MYTMILNYRNFRNYVTFESLFAARIYGKEWVNQIAGIEFIEILDKSTGEIVETYEK